MIKNLSKISKISKIFWKKLDQANTEINNWVNQYRKIWNFNYKIDSNILFLETLNIVDKFKNTYNGKETKHYIIKSDKSSKKSQRRKK